MKDESEQVQGTALQRQLQALRERGFTPKVVHVDSHSMFVRLRTQYPGVLIDVGGAKAFVTAADAKIRRIKEVYRTVVETTQVPNEWPTGKRCVQAEPKEDISITRCYESLFSVYGNETRI